MLLLLMALPVAYFAGGAYTETFPRPFHSEIWIAATGNDIDDNRRCAMLTDLRIRVRLTLTQHGQYID